MTAGSGPESAIASDMPADHTMAPAAPAHDTVVEVEGDGAAKTKTKKKKKHKKSRHMTKKESKAKHSAGEKGASRDKDKAP